MVLAVVSLALAVDLGAWALRFDAWHTAGRLCDNDCHPSPVPLPWPLPDYVLLEPGSVQ